MTIAGFRFKIIRKNYMVTGNLSRTSSPGTGSPGRETIDIIGPAILPSLEKKVWAGRTAPTGGDYNDDQPL